ncbi:MAG: radical SAM protein [bacterium]|nr:radical SAM protein [bacterium]
MKTVDELVDAVGVCEASAECCVAAILFTYRCSIPCRHCLFGCAGDRPDVVMTPAQCAEGLALLHETGRVLHIAGGEAMLYWEQLAEAIAMAHHEGHAPHFIETNCSFAADDAIVTERLEYLASHGVKGILASADPFHQEHVSPENFLRVRRLVIERFGEQNFYGSKASDERIHDLAAIARDEGRLREYVCANPPTMVGTAHHQLARYLDARPVGDAALQNKGWRADRAGSNCLDQFQGRDLWEIHIDPYGNIQTNCGMILGTLPDVTPAQLLADGPEKANRFVAMVCEHGPLALMDFARREHGFEPPAAVTQSCELCYLARRFLSPHYPEVFGPGEIYA